ncbi:hypothetical protein N9051_00925 [Akkermansiaceae bacterium]|nr:hypothetical protein [Akkermansiaceae bacterium]
MKNHPLPWGFVFINFLSKPIFIFLVTAALIGAAVWEFLQIEDKISSEKPDLVEDDLKDKRQPLPSTNLSPANSSTLNQGSNSTLPPAVLVSPNIAQNTGDETLANVPIEPTEEKKPPSRAIIVEEDVE